MAKRFCIFKMEYYYPSGGMGDFHSSVDTQEEAEAVSRSIAEKGCDVEWVDMEEYD